MYALVGLFSLFQSILAHIRALSRFMTMRTRLAFRPFFSFFTKIFSGNRVFSKKEVFDEPGEKVQEAEAAFFGCCG
jgi:hypothetical protein